MLPMIQGEFNNLRPKKFSPAQPSRQGPAAENRAYEPEGTGLKPGSVSYQLVTLSVFLTLFKVHMDKLRLEKSTTSVLRFKWNNNL